MIPYANTMAQAAQDAAQGAAGVGVALGDPEALGGAQIGAEGFEGEE